MNNPSIDWWRDVPGLNMQLRLFLILLYAAPYAVLPWQNAT